MHTQCSPHIVKTHIQLSYIQQIEVRSSAASAYVVITHPLQVVQLMSRFCCWGGGGCSCRGYFYSCMGVHIRQSCVVVVQSRLCSRTESPSSSSRLCSPGSLLCPTCWLWPRPFVAVIDSAGGQWRAELWAPTG